MRQATFTAAILAALLCAPALADTVVRFRTSLGTFDVELYDETMPTTVQNFLQYVDDEAYTNSFFHRSTTYNPTDIQIIQGGGFFIEGNTISAIPTYAPIPLVTGPLNLRGTIAMARTNDPDSATSGWFFNVQDNPGLDDNYAVFGRVLGDGMDVINAIAGLKVFDLSQQLDARFGEVPLLEHEGQGYFVAVQGVEVVPEPSAIVLALIGLAVVHASSVRFGRSRA